jgi:hypothetical protein
MRTPPVATLEMPSDTEPVANAGNLKDEGLFRDDLGLRARVKAVELILAQLVAERLAASGDPIARAEAALRDLVGAVSALPLPDLPRDERERFRDLAKYALYGVLEGAVAVATGAAGSSELPPEVADPAVRTSEAEIEFPF